MNTAECVRGIERWRYAILAFWTVCCLATLVARPGELLEVVLIGFAAASAWSAARPVLEDWFIFGLSCVCFLIPLQATWPVRVYTAFVLPRAELAASVLSPVSLGLVFVVLASTRRMHRRPSILLVAAAVAGIIGAIGSSVMASSISSASASAWSAVVVPATLGVLASSTLSSREAWTLLRVVLLAAIVPVTVALAAYSVSFGIPLSVAALVAAKMALFRPHLIQELTFGNVGHLASFAMLLLPGSLVVLAIDPHWRRKVLWAAVCTGLFLVQLVTLSRSVIVTSIVTLTLMSLALIAPPTRRVIPYLVLPLVIIAAVALTPVFRDSITGLLLKVEPVSISSTSPDSSPRATSVPPPVTSPTAAAAASPSVSPATDESAVLRMAAIQAAIAVYTKHQPWGVGTGQYSLYDDTNTAAHSLPVELLAENGLPGALGFLFLGASVASQAVKALRGRSDADLFIIRMACLAGAASFLTDGLFAGVALAIGPVNTWACLVWLLVGMASVNSTVPVGRA